MPDQKLKRLTIDLTEAEHRALKGHAAEAGVSMRILVLDTIRSRGLFGKTSPGAKPH